MTSRKWHDCPIMNVTDQGSGTPLVWVHGFPLSSRIWERQLEITGVRHIVPDLPGFGRSEPAAIESIDDYARAVLRLLDERGIERALFAGLSMGGYICFAIAQMAMERMQGLILLDTKEKADTDEARKGRYDTIEKVGQKGVGVVVAAMLPKMLTPAAPPDLVEAVREIMSSASEEGVVAALRAMATRADASPLLHSMHFPVLVVVGDQDPITPPADAERMAAALPDAKLVVVAGAAHLSNMEKAEEVNRAVREFVKRF